MKYFTTAETTPAYRHDYERIKYFRKSEVQAFRRAVRGQSEIALQRENCTGVCEWAVTDILTSTGLRCFEAADCATTIGTPRYTSNGNLRAHFGREYSALNQVVMV